MAALTFSGYLVPDGSFVVDPGFVVDGDPTPTDGPVEVVAVDRRGKVLARTRLDLVPGCAPPSGGGNPALLAETALGVVDYPDDSAGLEVLLDGQQVWARSAPDPAASFGVDWPRRFQRGRMRIDWRSSGDEALAAVAFSSDDGATWLPLTIPSAERTVTVDLSDVPGGDTCLLEVLVTDGFTSGRLRSRQFPLKPGGWRLWLLTPADGAVLPADRPVELGAQVYDVDHRTVSQEVTWHSSVDGAVAVGAHAVVALSPGEHLLTVSAHGLQEQVTVRVGAQA